MHLPRCTFFLSFLLLCVTLTSCVHMKALKVRMEAEKLYSQGRTEEIIPLLENILPELRKELGSDHEYIAECLNGLGMTYGWVTNEFDKSERAFKESLAIRMKTLGPEHKSTLQTMSFMGILYMITGRYEKAENILSEVVNTQKKILGNDHPDTAESRITLGQVYYHQGRYKKAEQMYLLAAKYENNEVSTLYPSPGDALTSLASLYSMLGDDEKAEKMYLQVLAIKQKAFGENHSMIAQSYDSLASLAMAKDEFTKAREYMKKSLTIKHAVFGEQHGLVGDTLASLSILEMRSGNQEAALSFIQQAIAMYAAVLGEHNPRTLQARISKTLCYMRQQQFLLAGSQLEDMLTIPELITNREMHWTSLYLYGVCLVKQGKPTSAVFFVKQAVAIIQELRGEVSNFSKKMQKGYLLPRINVYRFLAKLLIDQQRLAEAQQVLSMLKDEEFFDYVRGNLVRINADSVSVTFTVLEENWDQRYLQIQDSLVTLGKQAATLRKKRRKGLSHQEEEQLHTLSRDLQLAKTAYQRFLDTLNEKIQTYSADRIREISSKNLDKLKSMQGVLRDLHGQAVLLHYLETDDTLYLILTTDHMQVVRRVEIADNTLNRLIVDFRMELQSPAGKPLPLAKKLYNILFAPLAKDIQQANADVLMLSMDGPLRYLPAAALHDGTHYIAEKYAVVLFTEASKARLLSQPTAHLDLAGMGVSKALPGFATLPAVKNELDSIVVTGTQDKNGILLGIILLDEDFTKMAFVNALNDGFSVMHIASHFVFKPGTEQDSYLLLGDGSRLTLDAMYAEDMDFNDVEILTLSACETALGGSSGDGREIEGFGGLAQRQGAKTVLATLWPVADTSTATFMPSLYSALSQKNNNRARALQLTQQEFIHSKQFNHPFYWASFILMGNWL